MSRIKISELPEIEVGSLSDETLLVIVNDGINYKINLGDLKSYLESSPSTTTSTTTTSTTTAGPTFSFIPSAQGYGYLGQHPASVESACIGASTSTTSYYILTSDVSTFTNCAIGKVVYLDVIGTTFSGNAFLSDGNCVYDLTGGDGVIIGCTACISQTCENCGCEEEPIEEPIDPEE